MGLQVNNKAQGAEIGEIIPSLLGYCASYDQEESLKQPIVHSAHDWHLLEWQVFQV